jgi:hypothetical protein
MAGPDPLTSTLALPVVTLDNKGDSKQIWHLTVSDPAGERIWGAIVALYKQGGGRVIGQGFSDDEGKVDIYGAEAGDIIRVSSFDGGFAGEITVGTASNINLVLTPVHGLGTQAVSDIPHLQVYANPSLESNRTELFMFLYNFDDHPDVTPAVLITEPDSEEGKAPPLIYDPTIDAYKGKISFSATKRGLGRIQAFGEVDNNVVRLQSTYRLQYVDNFSSTTLFSNDGNLSFYLEAGSLPGNEAFFVIMPPGAVPGPLPAGLVLVGDPYDLTASGALTTLKKPAILTLRYDGLLVDSAALPPQGLSLYVWNPASTTWQVISNDLNEEHKAVVASITNLGTYALLASSEAEKESIFLPLLLKNRS